MANMHDISCNGFKEPVSARRPLRGWIRIGRIWTKWWMRRCFCGGMTSGRLYKCPECLESHWQNCFEIPVENTGWTARNTCTLCKIKNRNDEWLEFVFGILRGVGTPDQRLDAFCKLKTIAQ